MLPEVINVVMNAEQPARKAIDVVRWVVEQYGRFKRETNVSYRAGSFVRSFVGSLAGHPSNGPSIHADRAINLLDLVQVRSLDSFPLMFFLLRLLERAKPQWEEPQRLFDRQALCFAPTEAVRAENNGSTRTGTRRSGRRRRTLPQRRRFFSSFCCWETFQPALTTETTTIATKRGDNLFSLIKNPRPLIFSHAPRSVRMLYSARNCFYNGVLEFFATETCLLFPETGT